MTTTTASTSNGQEQSVPTVPSVVGSTHGENFGEVASKVLDVKSLLRPPLFSGLDKEWAEWRFRMDNTWTILGVDQLMK